MRHESPQPPAAAPGSGGNTHLHHRDVQAAHRAHRPSVLQLLGCLRVQLDLLLLLCGRYAQEVVRELADVHLRPGERAQHVSRRTGGQLPWASLSSPRKEGAPGVRAPAWEPLIPSPHSATRQALNAHQSEKVTTSLPQKTVHAQTGLAGWFPGSFSGVIHSATGLCP